MFQQIQLLNSHRRDHGPHHHVAAISIQRFVRGRQARLKVGNIQKSLTAASALRLTLVDRVGNSFAVRRLESKKRRRVENSTRSKIIWVSKLFLQGLLLILAGGAIFSALEYDSYRLKIESDKVTLNELKAYLQNNQTLINYLKKHHHILDESFKNPWEYYSAVFFAFTIATTIGYGNFSPSTPGGLIFTCIYGLVSIPYAGYILVNFAESALQFFTYIYSFTIDKVDKAFDLLDKDGGGTLDHDEMRAALEELKVTVTDDEFEKLMFVIDKDNDNEINREEFRNAVDILEADLSEVSGRSAQMAILAGALLLWMGLGTLYFSLTENWSYGKALYFSFITLSTVGLGDLVPSKSVGYGVLYAYTLIGLGTLAVAINLVTVIASKMKVATIQASQKVRRKLRNSIFLNDKTGKNEALLATDNPLYSRDSSSIVVHEVSVHSWARRRSKSMS